MYTQHSKAFFRSVPINILGILQSVRTDLLRFKSSSLVINSDHWLLVLILLFFSTRYDVFNVHNEPFSNFSLISICFSFNFSISCDSDVMQCFFLLFLYKSLLIASLSILNCRWDRILTLDPNTSIIRVVRKICAFHNYLHLSKINLNLESVHLCGGSSKLSYLNPGHQRNEFR